MKNSLTIPIIILNWNGIEDTLECMESLWKQTHQDFIVYLVDNGSSGNDATILNEKFGTHPQVKLILNKENLGFTRGNNAILRQIIQEDYEYVFLLNNDTTIDENCIENMLKSVQKNKVDMLTCKMVNYFNNKQMDNAGHEMLNTAEIVPIGHLQPVERFNQPFENIGSCAGATLYSTKMLRDIGVFDEYFDTGYEDAEIGLRAIVLGYKSLFEPTAIVYHKMSQSINKVRNFDYTLKIQLNIFYTYFKLMPRTFLIINLPFVCFKYFMVLFINLIFGRKKFFKSMSQAIRQFFKTEYTKAKASRHTLFQNQKSLSSFQLQKKTIFFLWYDIKRFYKYILLKNTSEFEKY